jgi:hypothetical protein
MLWRACALNNNHPVSTDNNQNRNGYFDIPVHFQFRPACNVISTQEIDLLMSIWDELAQEISLLAEPSLSTKLSQTDTIH